MQHVTRSSTPLSLRTIQLFTVMVCLLIAVLAFSAEAADEAPESGWVSLFNGKDLEDWTIKFKGHEAGINYKNTFKVEDGVLKVSYDEWEEFGNVFGHLFYKDKFSRYKLIVEYRFIGDQVQGGPGWAFRNNGVMIHSQSPESMALDQDFPVSIEVQLLGGDGSKPRTTANLCSPGTHVVMEDKLMTQHCFNSTSETYHGDQWVTVEIEVNGNESVRHLIDGKVVLAYEKPQLDEKDNDARRLIAEGAPIMVEEGYIALQAESHPTEFRRIDLLVLE